MTITEANTSPNPAPTAEEVGKRFLKLIGSVESTEDITVEHVEGIMELTLDSDPIYPTYSHELGNGWSYSVRYAIEVPGNTWGVELTFNNEVEPFPQFFPFCSPSYDDYHRELMRMGFRYRRGGNEVFPGTNAYDKDRFYVQIVPEIRQPPDGKAYPACVRKIGLFVADATPGHP